MLDRCIEIDCLKDPEWHIFDSEELLVACDDHLPQIIRYFLEEYDLYSLELEPYKAYSCFYCLKCSVNTLDNDEYYMIKDEIWLAVNPDDDGMMCIGCVEEVLGRELAPEDFTDCPLNQGDEGKSDRLLNRLGFI